MTFWDTQLPGVITGAIIGGAFAIVAQLFANRRQRKQFAYDLEARQQQFTHEKEQEIRGRRTATLIDLHLLLEDQMNALEDLWNCISDPDRSTAYKAWRVLGEGKYRRKSWWPTNTPASEAIDEYANKIRKLLILLHHNEEDIAYLLEGEISALPQKLRVAIEQNIKSARTPLGTAIREVANLTRELNLDDV